jgi:predicted kinase
MEAIIFIGLQGAGKSSFYKERFFSTHIRINLDMLRTRHRENLLLKACIEAKQRFVVDNTNVRIEERAKYVQLAKAAGFKVIGYYFKSDVEKCLNRNSNREGRNRVPDKAILGTFKRLNRPSMHEGFDEMFYVWINNENHFVVEEWRD